MQRSTRALVPLGSIDNWLLFNGRHGQIKMSNSIRINSCMNKNLLDSDILFDNKVSP